MNWLDRAVEACEGARWAEALDWCERGLTQEPDDLELQHRKGLCLLELGDEQAAIAALEATATSGHLESHYHSVCSQCAKGDGTPGSAISR